MSTESLYVVTITERQQQKQHMINTAEWNKNLKISFTK
jgi:hypothetical protein